MWTRVGLRKQVLDGGAHRRNLANTTEPSMYGGDAALCQITLTTWLIYVPLSLLNLAGAIAHELIHSSNVGHAAVPVGFAHRSSVRQ